MAKVGPPAGIAMLHKCDVLVIGGGAAAMRAALEAAQPGVSVIVVDKGECGRSGTSPLALHGLTATLHAKDSEQALAADILRTGSDLNDHDLVRKAAREAAREPALLEAIGVHFHRLENGEYDIYRGDGHSLPHGLTFDAEENGLNVVSILADEAWRRGAALVEKVMITDLLLDDDRAVGACGIDDCGGEHTFAARSVVLAAGGANRIFPNVVPRIAEQRYRTTGDALALALRVGLDLVDMEMNNFRNTPPASRLAAHYVNARGEAFMAKYDPMGEHAPRGKVVEALYREMQAGNGPITMEITPESERIAAFSVGEYKDYVKAAKAGNPPPVTITFQRLLGGVRIDDRAATAIKGLFAAGESTGGFHGGDRLQGAAFLETQVFGRLAGLGAAEFARDAPAPAGDHSERLADAKRLRERAGTKSPGSSAKACIRRIEDVAWRHASIIKDAAGLHTALAELGNLKEDIGRGLQGETAFDSIEAQNLLLTAEAIVRASLQRSETRGTHRRSDFPQADVSLARQHTSVRLVNGEMTASFVACRS